MRSYYTEIRAALMTRLASAITVDGAVVPVHDFYDRDPGTYPFVLISFQDDSGPSGERGCATIEYRTVIDIYTAYDNRYGGRKDSDEIEAQILTLLSDPLNIEGVGLTKTIIGAGQNVPLEKTAEQVVIRRVREVKHRITT